MFHCRQESRTNTKHNWDHTTQTPNSGVLLQSIGSEMLRLSCCLLSVKTSIVKKIVSAPLVLLRMLIPYPSVYAKPRFLHLRHLNSWDNAGFMRSKPRKRTLSHLFLFSFIFYIVKVQTYRTANTKSCVSLSKKTSSGSKSSTSICIGSCSKKASRLWGLGYPKETL